MQGKQHYALHLISTQMAARGQEFLSSLMNLVRIRT